MNRYSFSVLLQVEVDAFDQADATEAVEDTFGPGETGDLNVTRFEVVGVRELN